MLKKIRETELGDDSGCSLLEEIISKEPQATKHEIKPRSSAHPGDREPIIGTCIGSSNPANPSRVLIEWQSSGRHHVEWLPCVRSITPTEGDEVLLLYLRNRELPVVTELMGVSGEDEWTHPQAGGRLILRPEDTITIVTSAGRPLIEICQNENGPVVRIANKNTQISVDENLSISAKSIELSATQGEVKVTSTDDVVIAGKLIRLN